MRRRLRSVGWGGALLVALIGALLWKALVLLPVVKGDENLYTLQAAAWLAGRTDLLAWSHDAAVYQDRCYVPFPPFPSVLMLPSVALLGTWRASSLAAGFLLFAATLSLTLARLRGAGASLPLWLAAGLLFGSPCYLALHESGFVWFFAHLVSFATLSGSLLSAERGRALYAGLFLAFSLLSRQLTILALPLVLFLIWGERRGREKRLIAVVLPVLLAAFLQLGYNAMRFSGPFDTGYGYLTHVGFLKERFERYGQFHPAYIPFNLTYLLLNGPDIHFGGKEMLSVTRSDPFGAALPLASPYLLLLFARRPEKESSVALGCAGAIALCQLFYYNNGWTQSGSQRFTLDFLPLLVLPLARAAAGCPERLTKALILLAVGWNVLALVVI